MTDEEMAEEYTNNLFKGVNCCIGNPRARRINSIDVEQAFLAGLKAGRPQWHYVSEKGLPKESGRYFVYVGGGENGVYPLDFDTEANDFGYWCLDVGDNLGVRDTIFETITERNEDKVIAWKEIVLPELPKEIK